MSCSHQILACNAHMFATNILRRNFVVLDAQTVAPPHSLAIALVRTTCRSRVTVRAHDRRGLLHRVAAVFAAQKLDILNVETEVLRAKFSGSRHFHWCARTARLAISTELDLDDSTSVVFGDVTLACMCTQQSTRRRCPRNGLFAWQWWKRQQRSDGGPASGDRVCACGPWRRRS
eukprot:SAG11_NODE_4795_length_1764_cov_1.309910_1_plen_175_part_00